MEVGGLSVWDAILAWHVRCAYCTLQRYCRDLCYQNLDPATPLKRLLLRAQSNNPKVVMSFLMIFSYFFVSKDQCGKSVHQVGFFGSFDKNA